MQSRALFRKSFLPAYLATTLTACASGPEKPDTLAVMLAEDEEKKSEAASEAAADAKLNDDKAVPFRPGLTRPMQIGGPTPSLPPEAIAQHVTGTWIARCVITETGSVEQCKIVKGLRDSNAHLLQILKAQKYKPVMYDGVPQRVFYTFKITFK
ncbi:MAG TPA: energy transducer TonB [Polyangium sp.]|nr:energy transducer TonB [Polyangium sp.]